MHILLVVGETNEELKAKVWKNLINLSAYKVSRKKQKLLIDYACTILKNLIDKTEHSQLIVDNKNSFTTRNIVKDKQINERVNIFKIALKSFYYNHNRIALIIFISFLTSFLARLPILICLILGSFSFLIFANLFLIYGFKFSAWHTSKKTETKLLSLVWQPLLHR